MIMASIAKALTPEQVESMAEHVEAMEMVTPEVRVVEGADLREGQWLFEMRCMECHRFNGSGELAFGSPPLVGLQGWYLADQLSKFKTGLRGAVKGDENGAKMVFTSSFIENEQMLKDIVGYILTLNPPPASDPFSSR
jgi:cytochrome c553